MRYAIIGGGIAGLTAALRLRESDPGAQITVWESSGRIGGKLYRKEIGGHMADVGAESILARRPEGVELIERVGLADRLAHPATGTAAIWTHGALRPLPPTVMGIPADMAALDASGIIKEPVVNHPLPAPQHDVSVADFVSRRVGRPIVDRLVEPLLGGVYAGRADRLSVYATAPQIAELAPDLLAGAQRTQKAPSARPVFAGLRGGLGQLPEAVAHAADVDIRLHATVRDIQPCPDGFRLTIGPTPDPRHDEADAVIVAAPAVAASRLLAGVAPRASFHLAGIEYASMAIVTLVLDTPIPGDGSGFLVPSCDDRRIKAATVSSRKWAWMAAGGRGVIRASLGRFGQSRQLQLADADLIDAARLDLQEALDCTLTPVASDVQRWGGALPQYDVGHHDAVAAIESDVAAAGPLAICGAAYRGVGVPAVIANATAAVENLLSRLE